MKAPGSASAIHTEGLHAAAAPCCARTALHSLSTCRPARLGTHLIQASSSSCRCGLCACRTTRAVALSPGTEAASTTQ